MDISLIPETAPFNPEQRAWLNGFLAGWLGLVPGGTAATAGTPLPPLAPPDAPQAGEAAPEPWHDPALALDERLQLAEGQPLSGRLMAAMAQLDCGSCGYVCRTYAEAIAGGAETRLSLCSPGGSETAKALKRLVKEKAPGANGHTTGPAAAAAAAPAAAGWSRENPFEARLIRTVRLNGDGSDKDTRHVEIQLGADGPSYAVGDSLGVYPENCGVLVDELLETLGARGDEETGAGVSLRAALAERACLSEVTEGLLALLAGAATDPSEAAALRGLIDDDAPIAGCDVLDVLKRFPTARPAPAAFAAALSPLRPRLYSISSSPRRYAGQVHLTVRRVSYEHNGRARKGVASTMLADRVVPGAPLRVFVQKSHGFTLPSDPATPVIMVGPGTGVAPFRAFLHERDATGAPGKNWLFFGDQRGATDFLYESELTDLLERGVLTRLDTAFSRDQDAKVYVQHRMLERGAELFAWLEDGAHLYVCGDAKRMAADVDRALREVIARHGARSPEAASAYVADLTRAGRYKKDVY
jgi:sulfite reductase (NADPH) flavoprotein alpha-component